MRALFFLITWFASIAAVSAQETTMPPAEPGYASIAFHDVVDSRSDLSFDAITTTELIRFFDWLKGDGWTPISVADIERAEAGVRPLAKKAILLTFDDGFESVYSKVYPLLLAYHYPALIAVTGTWMDETADGMVQYGTEKVPRSRFLTWDQVREMAASGLVEVASHSFGLHTAILANPQGNLLPAAATWAYDPVAHRYEDDAAYLRRVREDLVAARKQMEKELGTAPRVLVWPFGRYTGLASEEAQKLGFTHQVTLYEAPSALGTAPKINRFYPSQNPKLADLATALRFDVPTSEMKRIACFALNELGAADNLDEAERRLGRMIDMAHAIGANVVVLDVSGVPPVSPSGLDVLSHAVWQMRTRAAAEVYLRLPTAAAGDGGSTSIYSDLFRRARADGLALDARRDLLIAGAEVHDAPSSAPSEVQIRRAALDIRQLGASDRATMQAFDAAAAIDPDIKLMLIPTIPMPTTRWPAPLADIVLLPPLAEGELDAGLRRLRDAGWFAPTQAPRVAVTLPAVPPGSIVKAARRSQAYGATAISLCPASGSLQLTAEEASNVSTAFSARTLPLGQ